MSEELVRFLAREADRSAVASNPAAPHPDENTWALLADGLISPEIRDDVLLHAAECPDCRRRASAIAADWEDTLLVASGVATGLRLEADGGPLHDRPETALTSGQSSTARPKSRRSLAPIGAALVACIAFGVVLTLHRGSTGQDSPIRRQDPRLLSPASDLTALGVQLDNARPQSVRKTLNDIQYTTVIRKLGPQLNQPRAPVDVLETAARAALSAADYPRAARYSARGCGVEPPSAEAQNTLGLAAFQLGAHADALAAFQRALELAPDRPEFVLNMALAAERLGQSDVARKALRRVVILMPDHPQRGQIDGLLRRLGP